MALGRVIETYLRLFDWETSSVNVCATLPVVRRGWVNANTQYQYFGPVDVPRHEVVVELGGMPTLVDVDSGWGRQSGRQIPDSIESPTQ